MKPVVTTFQNWDEAQRVIRDIVAEIRRVDFTYGQLRLNAASATQTLPAASTKITVFDTENASDGMSASHANDKIAADYSGYYLIAVNLSLKAASGTSDMTFEIQEDGAGIAGTECTAAIGTSVVSVSFTVLVQLDPASYVELYASGGQDVVYTFYKARILVKRVG